MAIMAPAVQVVKRADGRSSVCLAAYRAAALLYDERTGERHDYTRKRGVVHSEILAPDHAPSWVYDRQKLWAAVELANKRKDAQVAREFMLPLPHELTPEQRLALLRAFVREQFVAHGMIADFSIHLPDRNGDQRNHHAHLMVTMRHITAEGFGQQAREWNDDFAGVKRLRALRAVGKTQEADALDAELRKTRVIFAWREQWANCINQALAAAGHEAIKVDPRSWEDQGSDREAEPHMGVDATEMERRGEESDAGDERRRIQEKNAEREQREAEIINLQAERDRREADEQARAQHLAAAALDRTRAAVRELESFDDGNAELNHYAREIQGVLAAARRFEQRERYGRTLLLAVEKNFQEVYRDRAAKVHARFWKDVEKRGIQRATRDLLNNPARYGRLPGWQIGQRLFHSKARRQALQTIVRTVEQARQGFYINRKVEAERPLQADLQKRAAKLRAAQEAALKTPPEGRLLIQYVLNESARHLRREDWQKLTRRERFHLTQARQLMKHGDLRAWAAQRLPALAPHTAPHLRPGAATLVRPVDLKQVSPGYHREVLQGEWRALKDRQAAAQKALLDAQQEQERQVKDWRRGIPGQLFRITGHLTGLDKALATMQARRDARRHARQEEEKRKLEERQQAERKPLSAEFRAVEQRAEKLRQQHKAYDENAYDITTPARKKTADEISVNERDITVDRRPSPDRGPERKPRPDRGKKPDGPRHGPKSGRSQSR